MAFGMIPSLDGDSDHDERPVAAGDIISVWYRWSGDEHQVQHQRKCRPCVVIKAPEDGTSLIVVPISTKQTRNPHDCVRIPGDQRAAAGLRTDRDSWVKTQEVCKIDLPNAAIARSYLPGGRTSNVRGNLDRDTMLRIQQDIAARVRAGAIRKNHMKRSVPVERPFRTTEPDDATGRPRAADAVDQPLRRFLPGDPQSREERLALARERAALLAVKSSLAREHAISGPSARRMREALQR